MKPFEDSIPEEQEEKQEKLLEQLRRAYRQEEILPEREQQEAAARVASRLARLQENEIPDIIGLPELVKGSSLLKQQSRGARSKQHMHVISILAAVLVVGVLISSAILLFTKYGQTLVGQAVTPRPAKPIYMAAPVVVKRDGLEMTMTVTKGPYFLGELLAVDLSLTNHTHPALTLAGMNDGSDSYTCSTYSLKPEQIGGTDPHYALYSQPVPFIVNCGIMRHGPAFVPGQTIVDHFYVLLTSSGEVMLTGKAFFAPSDSSANPLSGHFPTLHIHVATQVPSDRVLSFRQQGSDVIIQSPTHIHLIAQTYILCKSSWTIAGIPGGDIGWKTLPGNTLQRPECSDKNVLENGKPQNILWKIVLWKYAIGAIGYAVIQGPSTEIATDQP